MVFSVGHIPGSFTPFARCSSEKEADCIDSRVRTMSSGYVNVTDVIPATPPQQSLRNGPKSAPGVSSKNCASLLALRSHTLSLTYADLRTLL